MTAIVERVARAIYENVGCHCFPEGEEPEPRDCICAMAGARDVLCALRAMAAEALKHEAP